MRQKGENVFRRPDSGGCAGGALLLIGVLVVGFTAETAENMKVDRNRRRPVMVNLVVHFEDL